MRPATSTPNRGASGAGVKPSLKQFLQELDDLEFTLEEDAAGLELLLDFVLLELDCGVTLEDDFGAELLLDFAELLLDLGADEELDETTLEELDLATPKCAVIVVSPKIVKERMGSVFSTSSSQ